MIRTFCFVAVLVSAATLAAEPAAPRPPGAGPQRLDFEDLAKQSKTVTIDEDALRVALVAGEPEQVVFSPVLDLGNGMAAVAWSECDRTSCRGWMGTLAGGAATPRLVRKVALKAPAKVFFVNGFAFEAPAFADLDGDGDAEIVLDYHATEPPRRAVGSLFHEYVVAYSPKDLSLVFSHELSFGGGISEDACWWTLDREGDRLIASARCNIAACLKDPPEPPCKPTRKLLETWRKPRGQKCYSRVANQVAKRGS